MEYAISTHALEQLEKRVSIQINREQFRQYVTTGRMVLETKSHRYFLLPTPWGDWYVPFIRDGQYYVAKSILLKGMRIIPQ